MNYCATLFELEQEFNLLSPEERKQQRLKRAKPVLDELFAWLKTRKASPKSALGQALTCRKNQWTYLNNYLLDGRLELSNHRAERRSVLFSLIETAEENGLDPNRCLVWALTEGLRLSLQDADWPDKLTPWNAPEACRLSK